MHTKSHCGAMRKMRMPHPLDSVKIIFYSDITVKCSGGGGGGELADLELTELLHWRYSTTGNPAKKWSNTIFDVNQEASFLHQISIFAFEVFETFMYEA